MNEPVSKEARVHRCFHNMFKPGHECKEPAKWIAGGCALTGHFRYCDKHAETLTDKRFRKPIP